MRTSASGAFTIAGTPGSAFGAFLIGTNIPPVPATRDMDLELDGHTGIYDGGTEISRLDISVQIGFWTNQGRAALKHMIRQFIAAIDPRNGYFAFSDGDDPTFSLNVKLTSTSGSAAVSLAPGDTEVAATLDLQFKCADPHWYSTAYPAQILPSAATYYTGAQTITNPGGARVSPLITMVMTGSGSSIQLSKGTSSFTFTDTLVTNDTIVVDTDNWTVTKNGANAISKWAGSMFTLSPGGTLLTPTGAVKWRIGFTPRWLA